MSIKLIVLFVFVCHHLVASQLPDFGHCATYSNFDADPTIGLPSDFEFLPKCLNPIGYTNICNNSGLGVYPECDYKQVRIPNTFDYRLECDGPCCPGLCVPPTTIAKQSKMSDREYCLDRITFTTGVIDATPGSNPPCPSGYEYVCRLDRLAPSGFRDLLFLEPCTPESFCPGYCVPSNDCGITNFEGCLCNRRQVVSDDGVPETISVDSFKPVCMTNSIFNPNGDVNKYVCIAKQQNPWKCADIRDFVGIGAIPIQKNLVNIILGILIPCPLGYKHICPVILPKRDIFSTDALTVVYPKCQSLPVSLPPILDSNVCPGFCVPASFVTPIGGK